jgi:NAD(P)-dependent dehydrogenase (short-subunit alcohol dehydrogenase family)
MVMTTQCDDHSLAFARRPDVADLSQQGPLTPDHVLRTKRVPLLGRDVESFVEAYQQYFETQAAQHPAELTMLDPAPRIILDADLGVCAIGKTVKAANMVSDLYRHTIKVISQADKLERYQALPASDIFEVEYWDLEQAKLRRAGAPPQFGGEVVLVTGAASGIGLACVDAFRKAGAAVVALDINPAITEIFYQPEILGVHGDVADPAVISHALDVAVSAFGGVDMLVLNAGIFPASTPVGELSLETWQKTMRVNLDANLSLLNLAHPLLKLAPNGGRVAVIDSKNVPAPGPGAAAYSASKAALTQLARVAALEWGDDNIRVNILHPNAVFDTGIWSDSVLEARAKHYGLSVEAYKRNNVLHTNITSHHVAELAVAVCGPLFAQTTGAQIPIDGGNERVI